MTTELPCQRDRPCPVDFPAAHSMDTTWFAVDRDGHIGVFESGEPGAVPKQVDESGGRSGGIDDAAVLDAIKSLPDTGEPEVQLSAVLHPGYRAGILPRRRRLL